MRIPIQNQALAQAAAEAAQDRRIDLARGREAGEKAKVDGALRDSEKKKTALGGEKTGDGNGQSAPGYRKPGSPPGEARGHEDGPPARGRIDIRV
ncbi:MAG TPA: hypothetical protein VFR02_00675 [bacterium]|nr:hypothetical protein [bacterium]